jgi:hypothetical protein
VKGVLLNAIDARQRRTALVQKAEKGLRVASETYLYPLRVVTDIAVQRQLLRQLPDKGAEAHPLHFSVNA